VGEDFIVKLPEYLRPLIQAGALNEGTGEALARWAAGTPAQAPPAGAGATISPEKALLAELGELLAQAPDQAAKKAILAVGFGSTSWSNVQRESTGALRGGIARIKDHLRKVETPDQEPTGALLSQDQVFELLGLARTAGMEPSSLQDHFGRLDQLPASRFEEVRAWLVGNPAAVPDQPDQGTLAL
jgi:hypothetical protein